ncbi:MAG: class I SAM-dependent methyltransferase [Candidatus Saccharimonadales bacterium]
MGYKERISQYTDGRPSYPKGVVDFIVANSVKDATVADIGAGTGKLTELLARRFPEVYAIDPDDGMRTVLDVVAQKMGNIITSGGSAEHTGLDDNSVDLICTAQSFHWFDAALFRKEVLRIMRPNGRLFIIHNVPPEITTNITLNNNEKPKSIKMMLAKRKKDRINFFGSDLNFKVFDNPILYSRDRYIKYFMSLSTGPDMKDENLVKHLVNKIGNEFDTISKDGLVVLSFVTELYTTKEYYK